MAVVFDLLAVCCVAVIGLCIGLVVGMKVYL